MANESPRNQRSSRFSQQKHESSLLQEFGRCLMAARRRIAVQSPAIDLHEFFTIAQRDNQLRWMETALPN